MNHLWGVRWRGIGGLVVWVWRILVGWYSSTPTYWQHFRLKSNNKTLGAHAVGLCATTYLVLGRVGLVLIGAAGGIVLHATWEASNHAGAGGQGPTADSSRKRRELGIEVVKRTLDWRASSKDAPDDEALKSSTLLRVCRRTRQWNILISDLRRGAPSML